MKKIIAITLALLLALSFIGCGAKPSVPDATSVGDTMTTAEILESILTDVPDMPNLHSTELTDENFTYYTFAAPVEGVEGLVSEPIIGSIPHSLVILRAADADAATALAKEMEENIDLRKWICVEAEKGIVSAHGSTVMMVMSSTAAADTIAANFDSLWA